MSEFNIDDILAEFRDGSHKKAAPSDNTPPQKSTSKSVGATDIIKSIDKSKKTTPVADDDYDEYKPTEPLFSIEQMRKIEAQRKESFKAQSSTPEAKAEKPAPAVRKTEAKSEKPAPAVRKTEAKSEKPAPAVRKTEAKSEKPTPAVRKSEPKVEKPVAKKAPEPAKKPATIFGDIEQAEKKPKKNNASVSINTNPFTSLSEKVSQYRFLFEELVKRDFKKKYKRTVLGVAWSVISPFLTFLIQYFIFSSLFRRNDSNFVIYLLTGNLMFHFFSDATTAGMFSLYGNAAVLSKIKVPKSIFLLSSNVASIFNFMLTLLVYFVFMIASGVSFGFHLVLMVYPIVCMTVFNIGISYILSALFVFFRDTQYLYSIAIRLLTYMSAIFYYVDSLPENIQFVFVINPVYRYIAYMRQLVIDATVPSITSHLLCLGFALGALVLGYLFHKKTEKNFVYYY